MEGHGNNFKCSEMVKKKKEKRKEKKRKSDEHTTYIFTEFIAPIRPFVVCYCHTTAKYINKSKFINHL